MVTAGCGGGSSPRTQIWHLELQQLANTTALEVHAWLDEKDYPLKIEVTDAELEAVNIHRNKVHGEWNYDIRPQQWMPVLTHLLPREFLSQIQ